MIYQEIIHFLKSNSIAYTEILHEPSTSCEHSQEMRKQQGLEGIGSKNIVFHAKGNFYLVTTLGDKDIKARNFKHEFGTKDIRFASQEEITKVSGATIGSIPPFGFENTFLPLYVDQEIFSHTYFCFNPGVPHISIQIATVDLAKIYDLIDNPVKIFDFRDEENKKIFELGKQD